MKGPIIRPSASRRGRPLGGGGFRHGDFATYCRPNVRCRCAPCREAKRRYEQDSLGGPDAMTLAERRHPGDERWGDVMTIAFPGSTCNVARSHPLAGIMARIAHLDAQGARSA